MEEINVVRKVRLKTLHCQCTQVGCMDLQDALEMESPSAAKCGSMPTRHVYADQLTYMIDDM